MEYNFRELVSDSRTGLNPRKNFILGNGSNFYITIKDIHNGKIVITEKTDRIDDNAIAIIKKRSRIKSGDILFTSIGRVGETAIVTSKDDSWDVNESVFVFTLNDEVIIAEYFCLLFQSQGVKDSLLKNSTGSTFKSIKMSQLERMNFEIPSIKVQKSIVEKAQKVNTIIEGYKQQLSELDILVKARFVEMFGDPLRNSMEWPCSLLTEVCEKILGGGTPSKSHPEYFMGTIPWVSPKDMKCLVLNDSIDHITEDAITNSTTNLVPVNSVLMVIRSGILKHTLPVAINSVPVTINQDMKAFVANDSVMAEYLMYYFKAIESDVLKGVRSVTADNIDFNTFKKRIVIVPPLTLQQQFAAFVAQTDKSKLS